MPSQRAHQSKSWYLIYTKPRQEGVALDNLLRQGYGVYLPRVREIRKRNGHRTAMVGALFPRYLFIHLDIHIDNLAPIRSTVGVTSLVRFGSEPAQVSDELIVFLKSKEGQDGMHEWAEQQYVTGERIRVADGVFQGYEGLFLARTSRERVLVLLDLLDRQIRMQVSVKQIEATHQK